MLAQGVEIEQDGQIITVRINLQEVSHNEMQKLVSDCQDRIRCSNARHIVFDMSQVEFLDSSCVGSLVELLQETEHVRGRIALAGCRQNVAFLFKVTRLDAVFHLFDDVNEAMDSL